MEAAPHRGVDRRACGIGIRWLIGIFLCCAGLVATLRADIPWPEVTRRVAKENDLLAKRPQGHAGEYFVVCTLYFTPKESGFTAERGFDARPLTRPGLGGRTYPRD